MESLYNPQMTAEQFVQTAFQLACEEVLEHVSSGLIPASVQDFAQLHDFMDANCLAGFCEDDLYPTFLAIFPKQGEDDEILGSQALCDAFNTVQNMVSAWIRKGGVLEAQVIQREAQGLALPSDAEALLVNEELLAQTGDGLLWEQWECVCDAERAEEAADMLEDIRARVLNSPAAGHASAKR